MTDHSKQHYYEAQERPGFDCWRFRIYRYDPSGNDDITIYLSDWLYGQHADAEDAACEWCEDNGIDAEMA